MIHLSPAIHTKKAPSGVLFLTKSAFSGRYLQNPRNYGLIKISGIKEWILLVSVISTKT